jgi:hypothetical protein
VTTTPDPAAELRAAASLMRERAGLVPPSPWFIHGRQVTTHDGCNVISDSGRPERTQYIASMHPAVALAVADWLENEADAADLVQRTAIDPHEMLGLPDRHALAVARAYLESAR